MPIKIVRVQNAEALDKPEVRAFFQEAFDKSLLAGGDFGKILEEFKQSLADPHTAVFVGSDDGKALQALGIILLPGTKMMERAQVLHFYNAGSDALRKAMVKLMVDFVREHGHIRVWAVNTTGASDRAFGHVFGLKGKTRRVGSILEIKVA